MLAAGVDGAPAGWICVTRDARTGEIASGLYADARALFAQQPRPRVLGLDIPIGMLERGTRACDGEARRLLERRRNSVFTAPLRPMLAAQSWKEACEIRRRIEGKRISQQLWNILRKIREVDEALRADVGGARAFVREVHPELCFRGWVGAPMQHPKKKPAGRAERLALVESLFGAEAFPRVRERYLRKQVGSDDILDAFAALWTAERILAGAARSVPATPPRDAEGLPMQMVW
jgi:predicted RNase H-like nuclease